NALTDKHTLTLTGNDNASVTLTAGDLNAATDSGVLTVTVFTDTVSSSNTITTGSNNISIADAGTGTVDDILVVAGALTDGNLLTLSGSANYNVTGLKGDVSASNSGKIGRASCRAT